MTIYTYVFLCTYNYQNLCTYCVYIYIYIYTHKNIYIYIYIHKYIYIYIHKNTIYIFCSMQFSQLIVRRRLSSRLMSNEFQLFILAGGLDFQLSSSSTNCSTISLSWSIRFMPFPWIFQLSRHKRHRPGLNSDSRSHLLLK